MDTLGVDPPHLEELGDPLRGPLGVAEGHTAVKSSLIQNLLNGIRLAVIGDIHAELLDIRLILFVLPDGDFRRVPLVDPGDVHDLPGDGGGEEAHLIQQAGHIVDKAHVQHPVRLVQHDRLGGIHPDSAPLHVVAEAAWRGHHDLGMLFQRLDLPPDRRAAIETHRPHAGLIGGQIPQLIGNLDRQLPCGRQNHRLNALILWRGVLHNGNAVGKGLAGARGGLGDDILPVHHRRNAPRLNRSGHGDLPLLNCPHNLRRQSQAVKPDALCIFHSLFPFYQSNRIV